jgi:hypothetical protein
LSFFTPVDVELQVLQHGNTAKKIQTIWPSLTRLLIEIFQLLVSLCFQNTL